LFEKVAFGFAFGQVVVDHHEELADFLNHFFAPFGVGFQVFKEVMVALKGILEISLEDLFYIFFTSSV
jgi:hypothetical protein